MNPAQTIKKCPKCGHTRDPAASEAPERCASCGLYFEKWAMRDSFAATRATQARPQAEPGLAGAIKDQLFQRLMHVPETAGSGWIAGRAVLLGAFLVWGMRLAAMDYRDGEMSQSFMHAILLPIHEAGHVLFIPFGHFMTILGGSLFQLLLPLIVAGALLWQNRDATGAAIGLWWCGISLMDLAPYIYDAKQPQLILLGGHTGEDGPHDWIYLLGVFGKVAQSQRYGFIAHRLGAVLTLTAIAGGAVLLWRMARVRKTEQRPADTA